MDSLRDIWRMVQRSAYAQLRYSVDTACRVCVGAPAVAFWIPPDCQSGCGWPVTRRSGSSHSRRWSSRMSRHLYYGALPLWALALPLTGTLYLLMTVSSAVRYWRGLGAAWKGRTYPL